MLRHFSSALLIFFLATILFGGLYPLAMTGLGQSFFPKQANGSLIVVDGKVTGSYLIGYATGAKPGYFKSRPSQAQITESGILLGSASNLAQNNPVLKIKAAQYLEEWESTYPEQLQIPTEMLFASASGLDPHISLLSAEHQAVRIAQERNMDLVKILELIVSRKKGPAFLRLAYVNINELNLALDQMQGQAAP